MKEFLFKFLQGFDGESSSKRLGFLTGWGFYLILNVFGFTYLLRIGQYEYAISMIHAFGLLLAVVMGAIAGEFYKKK